MAPRCPCRPASKKARSTGRGGHLVHHRAGDHRRRRVASVDPSRDDAGSQQLEVTASASTSADRRVIDVEVQCEPLKLAIGCSTTDGLWLLAALAWVRRRQLSGREGTRTPTPCGTRF